MTTSDGDHAAPPLRGMPPTELPVRGDGPMNYDQHQATAHARAEADAARDRRVAERVERVRDREREDRETGPDADWATRTAEEGRRFAHPIELPPPDRTPGDAAKDRVRSRASGVDWTPALDWDGRPDRGQGRTRDREDVTVREPRPTVRDAAIVRLRNEARGITEEPATISREEAQARAAGEVLLPDIGRATSYDEDQARVQAMLARAEADVRRERADPGTQGRTRDRGGFDHRNIRVRGSRGRDYPPATRGDRAGRQR